MFSLDLVLIFFLQINLAFERQQNIKYIEGIIISIYLTITRLYIIRFLLIFLTILALALTQITQQSHKNAGTLVFLIILYFLYVF